MSGENILVVDDEAIIGTSFKLELEAHGYHVDAVLNGHEALKAVKLKKYSLVFVDKIMPGIDGIETCREIKKLSPESIPIFMTGLFDKENILKEQQFIDAGGRSYYLYKPFATGELMDVVRQALGEK